LPNTAGTGQWTEGDPFTGVQSDYYWSGSTFAHSTGYAWTVYTSSGLVKYIAKLNHWNYVWPVRGGN
jgi:hypothetical protein